MNRSFHLPQITRRDQHRTDRATEFAKTPGQAGFSMMIPTSIGGRLLWNPSHPTSPVALSTKAPGGQPSAKREAQFHPKPL